MPETLRDLYDRLLAIHGPQSRWWPGAGTFAMPVSAILVQRVTWQQVETVLANLDGAGVLAPAGLLATEVETLQELIRPVGFMKAKARVLHGIAQWTLDNDDVVDGMPDAELRASLLAVRGVGPETADGIMLHRYGRSTFFAEAYARRLLTNED